jgi:peroxiredoxin family protein
VTPPSQSSAGQDPVGPARGAPRRLAIIVAGGSFNNLVQVATLIRTAGGAGNVVRVLFRDAAVLSLRRDRIDSLAFSREFADREAATLALLQAADFEDLAGFMRDAKEHGDDVKLYACTSSLYYCDTQPDELIAAIDEPRALSAFLAEDVAAADTVLTF